MYKHLYGFHKLDVHKKFAGVHLHFVDAFVAVWAFGVTLSITSHDLITKDATDTPIKGKNNNISCSFVEFDFLIKIFTYADSFFYFNYKRRT